MATTDKDDSPRPAPTAANGATPPRMASSRDIAWLGGGLMLLALLLAYLLVSVWPPAAAELAKDPKLAGVKLLWILHERLEVSADVRLLMLVMVAGGLGSFIHTATSFTDFVGNEKLTRSWIWWYLLKPFIGMALAVLFYVVVRGGFMSTGAGADSLNLYGIAALAGMAGMFSKQATDKLSEVFNSLFRTSPDGGDAKRKDDLSNLAPALTALEPASMTIGSTALDLVAKGGNFVRSSVVRVNDANRPTVFKDDTRLQITLTPDDVANEGSLAVTVFTPMPGGGTSPPLALPVAAPQQP